MTLDEKLERLVALASETNVEALAEALATEDEKLTRIGRDLVLFAESPGIQRIRLKMAVSHAVVGADTDELIARLATYDGPVWQVLVDVLRTERRKWRRKGGI